jgi:hypothetical protein
MAKAPTGDSDEKHSAPGEEGEIRSTIVSLTQSAARYVDKYQIRDDLMELDLGTDCLPGDIVSVEIRERPHDFIILRRRWIITDASRLLEMTLDHPARPLRA